MLLPRLASLAVALLALLLPGSHARELAGLPAISSVEPLVSRPRSLLQGGVPLPPNFCYPLGDCKPQLVPKKCPGGSIPWPSAAEPTKCLLACPDGYTLPPSPPTAPPPLWCIPKCPPGSKPVFLGGGFLYCARCPDKCSWASPPGAPLEGHCYSDCPADFPQQYWIPPPVCCSGKCPDTAPILASYPPPICRGVQGVSVQGDFKCVERQQCADGQIIKLEVKPRPTTGLVCPPAPPAIIPFISGVPPSLKCVRCPCDNSFPIIVINPLTGAKEVRCTAPKCPTGWTQCGPYCIKDALVPLFGTPLLPNCYNILQNFGQCIGPCPPNTSGGGTGTGNPN